MYYTEARAYIEKLIRIQRQLLRKGFVRRDEPVVVESMAHLSKYLKYYRYDSDEKMRSFFHRNRERIRILLPGRSYPGFETLNREFMNLQNQ